MRSGLRFVCRPLFAASTFVQPGRRRSRGLAAVVLAFCVSAAVAQGYTSVVVFGDSLSDVGNVADLTQAKYGIRVPGPIADYTDGRFTDGSDTAPAAGAYHGVWVEQFAAALPGHPAVRPSLEGGTNYAYGSAMTGSGTTPFTFGPSDAFSVTVNNMGRQISTYLATRPRITNRTLFVLWGGAIDVLHAKSAQDVTLAAISQAANVQRLIDAGGTQFLVLNLPPLGLVPRLNGSPLTSIPATQASQLFNETLRVGLDIVQEINFFRRPKIARLDVYGLYAKVLAAPSLYELVNVTDASQGRLAVNPDTYLFWDDLHPTTKGHSILARTALSLYVPGAAVPGLTMAAAAR